MINNIVHIFYVKQNGILTDDVFRQFFLQLPQFLQQEIAEYKHKQTAQSSLLGKIILRAAFHKLGFLHTLNEIKTTTKGRPFINDTVDFNISHSGDYVVCAISTIRKVGIDIEKHRVLTLNIAERYFTNEECNFIEASIHPHISFFDFWAIKESAIKCDGRGVEVLQKTYIENVKQINTQSTNSIICTGNKYFFHPFFLDEGYSSAVCATAPFAVKITEFKIHELG